MESLAVMSDDELLVLDGALTSSALSETAMDACELQGFATALVIGPRMIMPSAWLPWVWDAEDGLAEPRFESMEMAGALTSEVMRLYNEVATAFAADPEGFVPLFERGDGDWSVLTWCQGFMRGVKLAYKDWSPLIVGAPTLFEPVLALAGEPSAVDFDGYSDGQFAALVERLVSSLLLMAAYWRSAGSYAPGGPAPIRRDAPKLGRNDPCHCGSGLKYKKCHGLS